ncbi:MAG TPA: CpaF family protein [Motilibacteraceae bacterium]|nr:CpaF family protein [Motilibacteraceae bacterium]
MGLRDLVDGVPAVAPSGEQDGRVARYRRTLLQEVDLDDLATLDVSQRRVRLERVLGVILSREGPVLSAAERTALIRRVVDESLGLGVLEPLLADPSITEIMVNGPEHVYVERAGRVERLGTAFASVDQLNQTIDRIVSAVNRRVDESSPMVDARLPTGERVNVIIPPLSLRGPVLTIRRFPRAYTLAELVALGSLPAELADLLSVAVRARLNVVVSGGTGSGKTTLLNALGGCIPSHERIVTVEDAAELSLRQEHVITLETRPANVEGRGQVTVRDLVRNSLRMRPDRIVVGEVRGAETLDMLQAMNTGHDGSLTTVHANSAEDAMARLETLASMSELRLPYEAIRDQIGNAVQLVVHTSRAVDGSRRVSEVVAVVPRRHQHAALEPLATWVPEPPRPDGKVHGGWVWGRPTPWLVERFRVAGEALPERLRAGGGEAEAS